MPVGNRKGFPTVRRFFNALWFHSIKSSIDDGLAAETETRLPFRGIDANYPKCLVAQRPFVSQRDVCRPGFAATA